jgi:isopenicillin N synthase-like dioxygenase
MQLLSAYPDPCCRLRCVHGNHLQVKNAAGVWVDAPPIPGTFVCNIGDMLKVWSNGLYQPTLHRVVNVDPSRSRVSVPFFYEPAFSTRVTPPQELLYLTGGQPAYDPVVYGAHLESKVLSNFEL